MPLHTKQFKNNNKNQPNKQGEKKKQKKPTQNDHCFVE